MRRVWIVLASACAGVMVGLLSAASAMAQSYTASIQTTIELGNVAAGRTGDTTFRVDPATGAVIRLAGAAQRTSPTPVRALVTITCSDAGAPGSCDASNVSVLVGSTGAPTGRARPLSGFRVSMATASLVGATSGTSPIAFTIGPVGSAGGRTFYVGVDFAIAGDNSALPSGLSTSPYFVFVGKAPAAPTSGVIGQATATVFRALTLTKTSDLAFGSLTRPPVGSGSVTFDANTGLRTSTGNGALLSSPTPTLAGFTLTGEGGQVFSIAVQPTFVLAGATPLTVTTNSTVSGTQTFNSALGSQGTFTFKVGGSFPYSNGTADGSYSGTFTVTADYN